MGKNQQTGILSRPSLVHYTVDTKKRTLHCRVVFYTLDSHRVGKVLALRQKELYLAKFCMSITVFH